MMVEQELKTTHPIFLTIDLEFWWCSEFLNDIVLKDKKPMIEEASDVVLGLLNEHGIRSTFFVLGSVAEKYPDLIKRIHDDGHEIAAHSYSHRNVFDLQPKEFEKEVKKVTEILSSITSVNPLGFRAPNFSFDERTVWAYDILSAHGYQYSSSVFPFKTQLYGVPKAPLEPYRPSTESILNHDNKRRIIEFPASVIKIFGKNIPVSGGFYFRLLPAEFLSFSLKQIIKKRPAIFYLHLRDVYKDVPKVPSLPLQARFFHYHGLRRSLRKFRRLLVQFEFQPVRDMLDLD